MIRINLLPVRQIKKRVAAGKQLASFASVFFILLALLGIIGFYQASIVSGLNKDIAVLQAEKTKLQKTLNMIIELEKQKALIIKQIGIVKQLKKSSALTVHVLDEVALHTPSDRVWLNSLTQKGASLSLNAMALDNRTIAKYMDELVLSEYISDVTLASTNQTGYAGRNLKSFSLSCNVAQPQQAEEKKTAANK